MPPSLSASPIRPTSPTRPTSPAVPAPGSAAPDVRRWLRAPLAALRAVPLAAAGAVLAACGGSQPAAAPGPHLLVVSLDSVRRDLPSCYGGGTRHAPGVPTSPRIDRLAEEGVRLTRAYATTSWTLPSHLSLFAGAPELVHGVDLDTDRLAPDRPLLAEVLAARGYRTAGFFSGPYLEPAFGLDRGFERYVRCYGQRLLAAAEREEQRRGPGARGPAPPSQTVEILSHRDRSSQRVTDAALAELDAAAADGRPFFLFVHYFDPHYDYVPPAPYDRLLDPDYSGEADGQNLLGDPDVSVPDPAAPGGRRRVISERDLEHVRALYAGELAWTDAQLGRLLDRLAERGLAEDTLVVVLSDHGDEFFEHGGLGHRRTLHEEVLSVPLVLRWTDRLPAGRAVDGAVSLADVAPTVLELLGLETPPDMVGRSFAPALLGAPAADGSGGGGAGPGERGVIGRLVLQAPTRIPLAGRAYDGRLVTVRESYRLGAVEVQRARSWPEAGGLPAGVQDELAQLQERAYAAEQLSFVWHGADGERALARDDPRAREALARFREEHARLVAARRAGSRVDGEVPFRAELEALGYATASDLFLEREDWLVLPPPGDGDGEASR